MTFKSAFTFLTILLGSSQVFGDHCANIENNHLSNDFYFSASSEEGTSGDVVAVKVSLTVEQFPGQVLSFNIVASYDDQVAELLGEPVTSSLLEDFAVYPYFAELPGSNEPRKPRSTTGRKGFVFSANVRDGFSESLLAGVPSNLITLYFRLKGQPGDSFQVAFNDGEFLYPEGTPTLPGSAPCIRNTLIFAVPVGNLGGTRYLYAHSTRHVPGEVRIVPGDPTQSAPELAPEAKIYDPPPTPETARIRFELTGGLASPGAAEVPIDLHITSNFEFMGYHFSGRFPAEALELVRIENHIRKGIALIDNAEGEFTALSTNGARRMAAEGERVRASTLYFNVKPEVTRTQLEISLETLRNGMYKNGLRIRAFSSSLPVEFKIEPILINQAILKIDPRITVLGDANFDGVLDISDARTILGHLFLGEGEPECRHAADFDQDGQLSITDPINILGALFLGEPPLNGLEPKEVPCGE